MREETARIAAEGSSQSDITVMKPCGMRFVENTVRFDRSRAWRSLEEVFMMGREAALKRDTSPFLPILTREPSTPVPRAGARARFPTVDSVDFDTAEGRAVLVDGLDMLLEFPLWTNRGVYMNPTCKEIDRVRRLPHYAGNQRNLGMDWISIMSTGTSDRYTPPVAPQSANAPGILGPPYCLGHSCHPKWADFLGRPTQLCATGLPEGKAR